MSRQVRDRDAYERDKWFQDWHREQLGNHDSMIDIDGLGYCQRCQQPLYVVEATRSRWVKAAWVAERVAHDVGAELLVVYRDDERMPGKFGFDTRHGDLKARMLALLGMPPANTHMVWWCDNADAIKVFRSYRDDHDRTNCRQTAQIAQIRERLDGDV